jgi:hypothetical protein
LKTHRSEDKTKERITTCLDTCEDCVGGDEAESRGAAWTISTDKFEEGRSQVLTQQRLQDRLEFSISEVGKFHDFTS